MTWSKVDPEGLGDYVGRFVSIVSDFGWDMNDWPTSGILRGIKDGYIYIQDDRDEEVYEDFTDLGGSAVHCIVSASVRMG